MEQLCACGCGLPLPPIKRRRKGRLHLYIQGHSTGTGYRGKKATEKPDWPWIAGFIEGEGSLHRNVTIRATQKQLWPLERLQRMLGGTITVHEHIASQWSISGPRAHAIMRRLKPRMSPRRQHQIDAALKRERYVER